MDWSNHFGCNSWSNVWMGVLMNTNESEILSKQFDEAMDLIGKYELKVRQLEDHINDLDCLLDKKYQIIKELKNQATLLTNQEISNIRDKFLTPKDCDIYTFARAILRKAQEK